MGERGEIVERGSLGDGIGRGVRGETRFVEGGRGEGRERKDGGPVDESWIPEMGKEREGKGRVEDVIRDGGDGEKSRTYDVVKGGEERLREEDEMKKILDDPEEMKDTAAIHFGSREELEQKKVVGELVRYYGDTMQDLTEKLDMVIKHFGIVPIIGEKN